MSSRVNLPRLLLGVGEAAEVELADQLRIAHQARDRHAQRLGHLLDHRVALGVDAGAVERVLAPRGCAGSRPTARRSWGRSRRP